MGERKSVTIEVKNPEKVLKDLLRVLANSAWNDGVGQWIMSEGEVREESLDEDELTLWNLMKKIKEQM